MNSKRAIIEKLEELDKLFEILFDGEKVELHTTGGAACIMNGVSIKSTTDFDFIDQDLSAKHLRMINVLGDFDLIDTNISALDPDFHDRSKVFYQGSFVKVYMLSPEDIISMKLSRYSDKDKEDIRSLLEISDLNLLEKVIYKAVTNLKSDKSIDIYNSKVLLFRKEVLCTLDF